MNNIDFRELLVKHNLPSNALETTGLNADELQHIHDDHSSQDSELEIVGNIIAGQLRRVSEVHSLKFRVKEPTHLVAKIIRKKFEDPSRAINIENYKDEITDLAGTRVLHLFKEDWANIHGYITATWDLKENPVANYREGDPPEWLTSFSDRGCSLNKHKAGYRSVHYLIHCQPTKERQTAEVQVRTIFEEGWSEVDHRIRYPDDMKNPILAPLLIIFNRLSGNADELASYIQILKAQTEEKQRRYDQDLSERDQVLKERDQKVADLQARIEQLEIEPEEKAKIKEDIEDINAYDPSLPNPTAPTHNYRAASQLGLFRVGSSQAVLDAVRPSPYLADITKAHQAMTDMLKPFLGLPDPFTWQRDQYLTLFANPLKTEQDRYRDLFVDPMKKFQTTLGSSGTSLSKPHKLELAQKDSADAHVEEGSEAVIASNTGTKPEGVSAIPDDVKASEDVKSSTDADSAKPESGSGTKHTRKRREPKKAE